MTIPPAAGIALRALRSIVNEDPADRQLADWRVEANEYLDRLDAFVARVESSCHPQPCQHKRTVPYEPEFSVGDESDYSWYCLDCGQVFRARPSGQEQEP